MARLFKSGTNARLQEELFAVLQPARLASFHRRADYDRWLERLILSERWQPFVRRDVGNLELVRWGYFGKLLNIVIYEIVSNREVFSESGWAVIRPFLHVPIDSLVMEHLHHVDATCPRIHKLKGMTKQQYIEIQAFVRKLGETNQIHPINFDAAWSASRP